MKKLPKISNTEWIVLKALWDLEPATANQIIAAIPKANQWDQKTVRTMLGRLVIKGVLTHTTKGREFVYTSAIPKKDIIQMNCDAFIKQTFSGSVAKMAAYYVENFRMSPSDIHKIKGALSANEK